jgi:hypothetical protein
MARGPSRKPGGTRVGTLARSAKKVLTVVFEGPVEGLLLLLHPFRP